MFSFLLVFSSLLCIESYTIVNEFEYPEKSPKPLLRMNAGYDATPARIIPNPMNNPSSDVALRSDCVMEEFPLYRPPFYECCCLSTTGLVCSWRPKIKFCSLYCFDGKCKTTTTTTTTVTPSTQTTLGIVPVILGYLREMLDMYDQNITERMARAIRLMRVPICRRQVHIPTTSTTTTEATTTMSLEEYFLQLKRKSKIVAKCFVCGLESREIPFDANCADAFAGDFLPLVPMDPRARASVARYRKYCRSGNVQGQYAVDPRRPQAMYGAWTGGCSVRWTDLSGVYTQRACRNRRRPTVGRHFASKRMAKLEQALRFKKNGCIISPAASLIPLSRGVSLFARFHACVCTGDWCNSAPGIFLPASTFLPLLMMYKCVAV